MKKIAVIYFLVFSEYSFSQNSDIGLFYGRFYAIYKFQDYGTGFRNLPGSQYSLYPSISLNREYYKKISGELRVSFMAYEQYTGTRLYTPGFASGYLGGNISITANYSLITEQKFDLRIKAGLGLGIVPDKYQAEFREMFVYPTVDSISRGFIMRNFRSLFPTICTGLDFSYKIAKRYKISLAATYQKGFSKITEYDIYYNDGSGSNDQRARQWGTGDFYGIQLGLRYAIRDENGLKFGKKKKQ